MIVTDWQTHIYWSEENICKANRIPRDFEIPERYLGLSTLLRWR